MYSLLSSSAASCFKMVCASTAFKASTQIPTYDKKHKGTWDIIGTALDLHWILTGYALGLHRVSSLGLKQVSSRYQGSFKALLRQDIPGAFMFCVI